MLVKNKQDTIFGLSSGLAKNSPTQIQTVNLDEFNPKFDSNLTLKFEKNRLKIRTLQELHHRFPKISHFAQKQSKHPYERLGCPYPSFGVIYNFVIQTSDITTS